MENFLPVMGLATLGSLLGLLGGVTLLLNKKWAKTWSVHSIPFAAGVLIAVSLLDILPEAIEADGGKPVLGIVLLVMVITFLFEQFFIHFHHHGEHKRTLKSPVFLVIIGDTVHNFIDGTAIAASYLVNPALGILVAVATFLHEIPHEIGDFGLMLKAGWGRRRVILVNLFSAMSTYLGALIVLAFSTVFDGQSSLLLAVAGGLFLYIGASDLLPEVEAEYKDSPWHQAMLLLAGVALIWALTQFLPHPEVG